MVLKRLHSELWNVNLGPRGRASCASAGVFVGGVVALKARKRMLRTLSRVLHFCTWKEERFSGSGFLGAAGGGGGQSPFHLHSVRACGRH